MKPLIGITQRLITHSQYFEIREALALDWGLFFARYLPSFVPLPLSYEIAFEHYLPLLSGVILSGGNDLALFGGDDLSQKRDDYESKLIQSCITHHLPLFGVCRGAQMIAHYFGSVLGELRGHVGDHAIIIGKKRVEVNSFHHYGIHTLSQELCSQSHSQDGSIESFFHRSLPLFGVMWHIERERGMDEESLFCEWKEHIGRKK